MAVVIAPFIIAGVIAISRTRDYHHNFDDIVAGSLIGIIFTILAYVSKFHSVTSDMSGEIKQEEDNEKEEDEEETYNQITN